MLELVWEIGYHPEHGPLFWEQPSRATWSCDDVECYCPLVEKGRDAGAHWAMLALRLPSLNFIKLRTRIPGLEMRLGQRQAQSCCRTEFS